MRLKNLATGFCVEAFTDDAIKHLLSRGYVQDEQPDEKPAKNRTRTRNSKAAQE